MIEVIVSGSIKHLSEYDTGEISQPDGAPFTSPTDNGEQMSNRKVNIKINEGRPIPMDTPNELVYLDFKKYAYKNRSMFKRELIKNKDNGGRMFLTLSALWYKWARKDNKEFTHIKDKLKFGRALMVMMVKDNVVFSKDTWKKSGKITRLKENE